MAFEVDISRNKDLKSIKKNLNAFLEKNSAVLPKNADAKILLKPNFNSNMNALTGNTTDLRVIAGLAELLQERGYRNITIGEGTNSGFYRNRIDVASRLRARLLAEKLGLKFVDLNYSPGGAITFEREKEAKVATDCLEADLLINLPKLKMHHEVGISVCLKNMMGCLVGQENKKRTHHSLARNIIRLNDYLKPHLHIVDGLIAMEGNGPSDGRPVKMDTIVAGTDPYFVDMVCAEIVGMPYLQVTYLKVAEALGIITADHRKALSKLDLGEFKQDLLKPDVPFVVKLVCDPQLQKYFQMLRQAPGIYEVCNTKLVGNLFLALGIRQERFIEEEAVINRVSIHRERCLKNCHMCNDYCPLDLDVPTALRDDANSRCIQCLYCYMVCPTKAIELHGTFGFLKAQVDKYDPLIRKAVRRARRNTGHSHQSVNPL